jgi:hypothetical protein
LFRPLQKFQQIEQRQQAPKIDPLIGNAGTRKKLLQTARKRRGGRPISHSEKRERRNLREGSCTFVREGQKK